MHLALGEIGDVIPPGPGRVSGVEHRRDVLARHPLRRRDRSARQALRAQLQHQLRSDLSVPSLIAPSATRPVNVAEGA